MSLPPWLRRRRALAALLLLQAGFAVAAWSSGTLWATWAIECGVGAISWDTVHGLNPALGPFDYFDRYGVGYLFAGWAAAPLVALGLSAIAASKAVAWLTLAGAVILTWELLDRIGPPPVADLGAAAVAAPTPLVWAYLLQAGNFHATELLPELAMALLAVEIAGRPRAGAGWWLALGLAAGLAVSTSFGAAAFVAAAAVWLAASAPWARSPTALLSLPALALGVAPLIYKLALHRQYGQQGSQGLARMYVRPDPGALLTKAGAALVDLPANLAFPDAWTALPSEWVGALPGLWLTLCGGALVVMLGLSAGPLRRGTRGLLRPRTPTPDVGPLLVPGMLLAFACAYLLSDQWISPARDLDAQLRASRFLPAPLVLLSLGPALLLASRAHRSRLRGLALGAAVVVPLLGLGSWLGLPTWDSLTASPPYRGRCYDLVGLYMAQNHPDPLGPHRDWRVCEGFAPPGPQECFLGWVAGVGQTHLRRRGSVWQLDERGQQACRSLPEPWSDDCWRQAGWGITMRTLPELGGATPDAVGFACDLLGPDEALRCHEGYGFYLADHYAFERDKLQALVARDAGRPAVAAAWYRGVGHLLRHELADRSFAQRWCAGLAAPGRTHCLEGVAAGFSLESRPLPPEAP